MKKPTLGDPYWMARGPFRPLIHLRWWGRALALEHRFWLWFDEWAGVNAAFRTGERMGRYQGVRAGIRYVTSVVSGTTDGLPPDDAVEEWWRLHDVAIRDEANRERRI